MKKLTKSSLAQMAALLPELDAEDQRCILGGTATTTIPPGYTGTVPEPTTTVPTTVDPYAVTGSMPTATTSMPTATSTTTTTTTTTITTVAPTGSYTLEAINQMINNGTWMGGYVDGVGYIGEATVITGYYPMATGMILPDVGVANTINSTIGGQNIDENLPWYQDLLMSTGGGYCRFMNQEEIQAFQKSGEVNADVSVSSGIGVSSPIMGLIVGK